MAVTEHDISCDLDEDCMCKRTTVCATCGGTNIQVVEWIDPNTNQVIEGDPYADGRNTDHHWCGDCDANVLFRDKLEAPVPEWRE